MSKFTNIPSEIRNFFSEDRVKPVMDALISLFDLFRFADKSLGSIKRDNCQLTNKQMFQLLVLLPFLSVKYLVDYSNSALSRMFGGQKSIFTPIYRKTILTGDILYLVLQLSLSLK